MTSEELDALEKLEKAATPGPWHEYSNHDSVYGTQIGMIDDADSPHDVFQLADTSFDEDTSNTNAELMAALRNAAPALIAAARENADLRAKLADAEKARDEQAEAVRVLAKCYSFVEADAMMVADLTRHAPLDAESQAKHDSTEAASEALMREIADNPAAAAAVKEASGG
jgi:hypothetical protein